MVGHSLYDYSFLGQRNLKILKLIIILIIIYFVLLGLLI